MSNIITAISEEKILKKIINNKITENRNILYKEAIIDILKKNKNIEIIIISENIQGDIDFIKLIKKIKNINKKIEIIIILSNKKLEKELIKNNIKSIYYNNLFSINKLLKKLNQNNLNNKIVNKKINNNKLNKRKINYIINKFKNIKNKINNKKINYIAKKVIMIYGNDKINRKIIKLIILKKLLIENKKIIIINIKTNKIKKQEKKIKIINIKKIKNKYYLKIENNKKLKEKIINKNIKEIININKILKNKNRLIKIKILKNIIKKYNKNYYLVFDIEESNKITEINTICKPNTCMNIIVMENNKQNLIKLNKKIIKNIYLIIINYKKNNLSKYFYQIILKNKFNKIKIINYKK